MGTFGVLVNRQGKQAKKSGYIVKNNAIQRRIITDGDGVKGNAWFDEYDKKKLQQLHIDSIVEDDMELERVVGELENNVF